MGSLAVTCDDETLIDLDPATLASAATRIRRTLRAHGATSSRDDASDDRWSFDPYPLGVDAARWEDLAAGLSQRARALNFIVSDILGAQRLLSSGILPTSAILRHSSYVRPCVGFQTQAGTGCHLPLVGSDVVIARDGTPLVTADHTEAPAGAGMVLEIRQVMGQQFATEMAHGGVRRLVDWYDTLRSAVAALAPIGERSPRTAILTPGPYNPGYFEHALLARHLGFTLVQPADLTIRSGRVWLKSLQGLERVHVLVRHVLSDYCDPLELRGDSLLGVAGLVEATRRGSVVLANSLGSGVAENPAVFACIDQVLRVAMGEEPLLRGLSTQWCGFDAGLSWASSEFDQLAFRRVAPSSPRGSVRHEPVVPSTLSSADRDAFRDEFFANPELWVGQEIPKAGEVPCLVNDAVVNRPVALRTLCVSDDADYRCLSGGFARTLTTPFDSVDTGRGAIKDVWVTDRGSSDTFAPSIVPRIRLGAVDLRDSVTSRAAEGMYWLGRNSERADALIRTARAGIHVLDAWPELAVESGGSWLDRCCALLDTLTGMVPWQRDTVSIETFFTTLDAALTDSTRPQSLTVSLHHLLRNAESVRELFGTDWWRLIAGFSDRNNELMAAHDGAAIDIASAIHTPLLALNGLFADAMMRDPGWLMLEIGRRFERALLLIASIEAALVEPTTLEMEPALHEMVLTAWDSIVAYRRRYRSDIELDTLLDLLIHDMSNPRSVRTQLDHARSAMASLPGDPARRSTTQADLDRALHRLDLLRHDHPAELPHPDGRLTRLSTYLEQTRSLVLSCASTLELEYFVQIQPPIVVTSDWLP